MRLFNRQQARFNDRPVDDQVVGHARSVRLPGFVRHDTFYSLHEVFNKLNSYTTRLVKHQQIKPSLARGIVSAIGAFFKWYLFSGAWRYGKVGVVTGLYATFYSFLKYFKAWYAHEDNQGARRAKANGPLSGLVAGIVPALPFEAIVLDQRALADAVAEDSEEAAGVHGLQRALRLAILHAVERITRLLLLRRRLLRGRLSVVWRRIVDLRLVEQAARAHQRDIRRQIIDHLLQHPHRRRMRMANGYRRTVTTRGAMARLNWVRISASFCVSSRNTLRLITFTPVPCAARMAGYCRWSRCRENRDCSAPGPASPSACQTGWRSSRCPYGYSARRRRGLCRKPRE